LKEGEGKGKGGGRGDLLQGIRGGIDAPAFVSVIYEVLQIKEDRKMRRSVPIAQRCIQLRYYTGKRDQ